jgi:hypothetical protein
MYNSLFRLQEVFIPLVIQGLEPVLEFLRFLMKQDWKILKYVYI